MNKDNKLFKTLPDHTPHKYKLILWCKYWAFHILPQICTASAEVNMKHALKEMQCRIAVIYGTLSRQHESTRFPNEICNSNQREYTLRIEYAMTGVLCTNVFSFFSKLMILVFRDIKRGEFGGLFQASSWTGPRTGSILKRPPPPSRSTWWPRSYRIYILKITQRIRKSTVHICGNFWVTQ